MKTAALILTILTWSGAAAFGQASPTASRTGDLQIGGGYTNANSDYLPQRIRGMAFYADFDFREHFGVELAFHQLNDPKGSKTYERTYEVGGRYLRHYGRFAPYGKAMYGRGVFNFPFDQANLAYNMFAGGLGVDMAVHPRVNVRVEYEFQRWFSFPPNGLSPSLITIGAAYHFPAGRLH